MFYLLPKTEFSKIMDTSNILLSLNASTNLITPVIIQDIMKLAKRPPNDLNSEFWNLTADLLWNHLNTTFQNIDDQLLCSTSFYSVLINIESKGYLSKIKEIIETEWLLRKTSQDSKTTLKAVSLMYGLFQSSFLTNEKDYPDNLESLLKATNNLLIYMAYEYTQYTFIVFKTLKSYQKVCSTSLQRGIYSEENQKYLLNMVNHNWENPITGIRDMCKEIFQLVLSIMNETLLETVIEEVNIFYWNKAKFFMVAGIIKHKLANCKDDLITRLDLNKGLFMSLHKPGLVSAGADMYFEVLKKLKSSDEWCDIFLQNTLAILTGSSRKAIENFINYWYLATLKTFPNISKSLLQELQSKSFEANCKLYSILSLMKQSNKLGILEKNWDTDSNQEYERYINQGLIHCDTAIRILAFEIICISPRKVDITNIECELVLKYLQCNVNSDCTVLRQSMLSNFNTFITRMHQYYKSKDDVAIVTKFSHNMQGFIIESLNYNGNYQRKLTTVKIFQIIFKNITETPKNKTQDKKYSLERHKKYLEYWLSSQREVMACLNTNLNDPADDIRQTIAEVLLDQSENIPELIINELIEKATQDIKSKFFFDIDCALNKFKLIANILVSNDTVAQKWDLKNVDELFQWGFQCLIQSYERRKSPVDAIFKGKQMHPYISVILVVLQVCQDKSYKLKITQDNITRLLDILEYISRQFADEEEVGISTDFAQMNALIEKFIAKSSYSDINNKKSDGQTSGLHKLVLNSLWLNVKASCELAVFFIIYFKEDINVCNRCLKVITDVLETSRHKGAIEAAGFCLGQAIKHLSSISGDSVISELPYELLKCKLQEWITEANKMASVTRRGAGMSIMVHRIVSSDMQKGKPLFHFFMKRLLEVCNSSSDLLDNTGIMEKDLPKAIFIHFLTKIVTDSSLAAHTLYYSTELAEIAFNNLTNGHWQIRNAALQLYGALVPKLIGQKKASGSDMESVATVAVDEFKNHFPKLWNYIKSQIIEHKINTLEGDSNLVPHLNLLASLAKKYNFSFEFDTDHQFLNGLFNMLGSPIFVVRRLAAQSIYKMYSYENVYGLFLHKQIISENQLHGSLLLIQHFCNEILSNKENFNELQKKFNSILTLGTHSYLNREIYEIIFGDKGELKMAVKEMYHNRTSPGVYSWLSAKVKLLLSSGSWLKIHDNIKMIFLLNDSEIHLETLYKRILTQDNIPKDLIIKIATILLSCKSKYDSFGMWKVLYSISHKVNLDLSIDFREIVKCVKSINSKNRFLLALMARSADILPEDVVYFTAMSVTMIISKRNDEELKYIATVANNELAKNINFLNENTKLLIVINVVKLLQDENEDIRNESANFIRNIQNTTYSLNPFLCLHTIFNKDFMKKHFNEPQIAVNCLKLTFAQEHTHVLDNNDPFAKETPNIYEEPNVIRKLVDNLNI